MLFEKTGHKSRSVIKKNAFWHSRKQVISQGQWKNAFRHSRKQVTGQGQW